MKTKLQITIVAIACLIYGQNVKAQVTYNFDSVTPLAGITSQFSSTLEAVAGTAATSGSPAVAAPLTDNTTNVLHPLAFGANNTGLADLDNFPTTNADCNVTWKEYITTAGVQYKKGVVLRGNGQAGYAVGSSATVVSGLKQGYYFMAQNNVSGSVTFRIFSISSLATLTQLNPTVSATAITVPVGAPMWYRASVVGSTLKMEYSTDGINFLVGQTLTDTTYSSAGATQLLYGIGIAAKDYYFDDVTYRAGAPVTLGLPSVSLNEKSIVVFKKDNTININSAEATIKSVQLFDVNGRVIARKNNVNALETSLTNLTFGKGLILVQITGTDNKVVTRKLVN